MATRSSLPLHDRLGRPLEACACRSRIAATCAALIACRRRVRLASTRGTAQLEGLARLVEIFAAWASPASASPAASLLRQNLDRLIAVLAQDTPVEDLALTTNGILFADQAEALGAPGSAA